MIEKAKEILSSGVKVFLQVDKSANDADAMKREQVSKLLRDLAQENHVYALSQIASEAQAGGPFDKVIGMVESACSFLKFFLTLTARQEGAFKMWARSSDRFTGI